MSSFKIKLDENLAQMHVDLLKEAGYDADRVHDEGLSGTSDEIVWLHVQDEGRFFITLDLDFSDVRRYSPGTHPGILLLRARNNSREKVKELLSRVIAEQSLKAFEGCLVVATEQHTRIRRPPALEDD
jgi:predicted nuclease of predicted toxin-antitoxin system